MKRHLAPEAFYHKGSVDTIRQHGNNSPDFIPAMEGAAQRMRELDPTGEHARQLLLDVRSGKFNKPPKSPKDS